VTNIFIGSASGFVYMFQDNGTNRTCIPPFRPAPTDFGRDPVPVIASRFISSPGFTINPSTGAVSGVFIGAAVDVTQNGTTRPVGKLYALNTDGTLIWQYPPLGAAEIGAITSSPVLGAVDTIFFTSEDGYVYGLTASGTFKWKFRIGMATDPRAPLSLSPSPLYNGLIFAPSRSGQIFSLNPDGSFRWSVPSPDESGFLSSLAIGLPATTTPTITPTVAPTPTPPPGATATTTATPTPVRLTTAVFGVTENGMLVQIDAVTGMMNMLLSPAARIVGPVFSSPYLSVDGYLVVGAADGKLHAINTITGMQPTSWPETGVVLGEKPIRSSPSVDNNGIIYVGADDGIFYAVGTQ
jgi:outer membrane protein assembly factor BamB